MIGNIPIRYMIKVKDKDELKQIIKERSYDADLNDLDVSKF